MALAVLAAPGMCSPADPQPCVHGTPSQTQLDNDQRGEAQRNHGGLLAALRATLACGDLGQLNGLPATIIVSAELPDLLAMAGVGLTGGATTMPMTDVIRLASHAHHYLRIFDGAREIGLFHTRRIAPPQAGGTPSPGQRIVLYARDHGCSHPASDAAAFQARWMVTGTPPLTVVENVKLCRGVQPGRSRRR